MGHHIQHSLSWHYAYRGLAAVSLAMTLLTGSAVTAFAQSASPYDGIGSIPLPPLDASSPYMQGSPRGEYVIPGTRTKTGQKKAVTSTRLPPLPHEEMRPPLSLSSSGELPSPRRLANPVPSGTVTLPRHDPAILPPLTYSAPSHARTTVRTYYPKPHSGQQAQPVLQQPVTEQHVTTPPPMPEVEPQLPPQPVEPVRVAPVIAPSPVTPPVAVLPQAIEPQPVTPMIEPTPSPMAWTPEPAIAQAPVEVPVPVAPADVPAVTEPNEQLPIAEIAPLPEAAVMALDEPAATTEPAGPQELQEPIPTLSEKSREILAKTPSGIDSKTVMRTPEPVIIRRVDPNAGLMPDGGVRTHEEIGLKIEVRKADVNIHHYLEQGYENLLAGRTSIAAGFYEQALEAEPKNEMALFGLATTYQRMNRLEEARDLYGRLLSLNPTHREALNNFMVLVSQESPQAAIEELEKLETENPDFSPIPAQLGIIYKKLGNNEMAAQKLARALTLSPDNTSYKYNLAITLDSMGRHAQAADLYIELVEDYNNGASLPGDPVAIQNRAIFLRSKS